MSRERSTAAAHALVFGASGLAGWAIVDQILKNYPKQGTFSKVTALVNRPLSIADSFWPDSSSPGCPELDLVCNINLAEGSVESFTELLKENVLDIGSVTHAFYFVYKQEMEPKVEVQVNCQMMERAVGALQDLCPELEFVVFPSGSKVCFSLFFD